METGKKKAKQSFSVPSVKCDVIPGDKEKTVPCFDKNICKKVDDKSRGVDSINLKQKRLQKQTPAADGDVPKPRKVVGKSLTDDEYDEIFMAVLQSVSSAEKRGEVSDDSAKENLIQEESDKDETSSQVIEVIVKVEETEDQKDFDYMENEDIDKWDNKTSLSRDNKEKENNVQMTPLPEIQFTKPDSTVKDTYTASAFCTKSVKPPKSKQACSRKDICSDTVHSTSTSDTKKVKKTSTLPKKVGKEKKQESQKPETSLNKDVKVKKVKHVQKTSLKKKMSERELEDVGTWVQCVNSNCLKWRYLPNVSDPMALPDRWECRMNTVAAFNSCEKPEESYDESEHIFTKYTEGSVVLAKMAGYPWWPAMIEIDPDYETYYEVGHPASMLPTKYHVVFFDKIVSRAWINIASVKPFTEIDVLPRKCKGHDYTREVKIATDNANAALNLPLKERLKKYSFSARFSGKWGDFKSNTDQDNAKDERKKSKLSKCSKKRKIEQEDNLVDDETLNQILNNSQSVLSDVAGILDSMENDDFNCNANSEYQVSKPNSTVKKVKIEGGDPDLQVSDARCGDSESMKEAAKFEVAKLDMDIFTMELGSVQLESQDQLNTDLQGDDCCSAGESMALPDSVNTGNIDETGAAEMLNTNSAGKKNKSQKKKSADDKDKKQHKPKEPKPSGEQDICVQEETTKKKKKNKRDGTAIECPEVNLEKSKKRTIKEGKTRDCSNRKPGEDNVEWKMQHKMDGKKSDKSLKCTRRDGKPESSVLGMCSYNKMKIKNISNEGTEDNNTLEIKRESEQRQNTVLELKTNMGQDKRIKKKKSKFINPVHAAREKVSNTSNSDKKSGDSEVYTEDKKYMTDINNENTLVKPSSQSSRKKVLLKETEQDMSDGELYLDFNIPVKSTLDKIDSDDDDFMLDEPDMSIHRSAMVTQEEDSDPLDFEE
ncbi:PC4 and SFRS1-interacting protein-like [Haliotis asinina]|uniref:PC4 and SFRS1-interacting protein-like n=1 Tax=Haliotis asinina TaxID=109174 RepID=UPI003531B771